MVEILGLSGSLRKGSYNTALLRTAQAMNAIDWASRPANEIPEHFGGKPVAVLGASLGRFGTLLSQDAWLSILRTLGTRPWFEGRMLVSGASKVFDHDGRLVDEGTRERLQTFLDGFANFVKSQIK